MKWERLRAGLEDAPPVFEYFRGHVEAFRSGLDEKR